MLTGNCISPRSAHQFFAPSLAGWAGWLSCGRAHPSPLKLLLSCDSCCTTPAGSHRFYSDALWRLRAAVRRRLFFPSRGGCRSYSSGSAHFKPFSYEDEVQLAAVLTEKPRHVTRHIRQSMLRSQKRIQQFRNSVTYLMILLQARLQKKDIAAVDATRIMESIMRECVELRQGDMAHLLFRAALRFRKHGVAVGFPLVKCLYESYKLNNAKDLMRGMADELQHNPALRIVAVLAYQFSGEHEQAARLLKEIPRDTLQRADYCALVEGLGANSRFEDIMCLLKEVLNEEVELRRRGVDVQAIFSSAIVALRGDAEKAKALTALALQRGYVALSEAAMGAITRLRLSEADLHCVADVYKVEQQLCQELGVSALGTAADTAIISHCTELMTRGHERVDGMMLEKVRHLKAILDTAIENDQLDEIDPFYALSLIRGFGVLGQFKEMRASFDQLQRAGIHRDHRLYDEMLKWYSFAHNLKEVVALKEEMTAKGVLHTSSTYHNLFKVFDRYYPRMAEKYFLEMRSKGIAIEGFMYPTLLRVFSELGNYSKVEDLYQEVKTRAARGDLKGFVPGIATQMIRCYCHDHARCESLLRDVERYGLLAHERVQAEVAQYYSLNGRQAELQDLLSRVPHKFQNIYRVLICDATRRRDREGFERLLKEMRESGVPLNERLFNVILLGFGHFNNAEGVRQYFHQALASDSARSALFFAEAAAAYARLGDGAAVDQCWRDLLSSGVVITMPAYNRFLDLYMAQSNMPKVQEILDTMMKLVPPNPVTATTVVDMLGKMGRLSEMEAVLEEMAKSTNAAPTLVTYHQALSAYAKCGDVNKMEAIRERMTREGFQENHVTYNILFEGYGRSKRYDHLKELREARRQRNIAMEEYGYVVLLNIYARARMSQEVEDLVDEMVASGVDLSTRLLSIIASAFGAGGNVPQMEHYVALLLAHPERRLRDVESVYLIYVRLRDVVKLQELLDSTTLPTSEFIYNACVGAFARAGEHTKVAYLLTQMETRGYQLSRNTSVILSSLLLKAGKLELAQTVLRWKGLGATDVDVETPEPMEHVGSDLLQRQLRDEVRHHSVDMIHDDDDEEQR